MLNEMDRTERLKLMKFVCSFAWADLQVRTAERAFVAQLIRRLNLDDDDKKQVREWLEVPPAPETVDPTQIPVEHRVAFLDEIEGVVISDGEIAPEERENLELLRELLV
ncbi:TerB family tellurite resistance protein [Myxococcota bacterium]|nr:TerB family tellurite resistance protein [Myxococcota bacterium]